MINIKNFSYNFIKYFSMGLAFALIFFLFKSCEVNAQAFSPTYRGVEVTNQRGAAILWDTSVTPTGRSGISFYSFRRNNDVNAYSYRFKITDNFHWNFGKSIVSGYAFCQSHTETGMDLYGCDSITLVSEVQERIPCSIEQKDQVSRFSCNSTDNFVIDYVELGFSYPADPYSITGVGAMSIDYDPSKSIIDSNKEIKDGVDRGNQIQQDTNNTIKDGSVDSGGITALTETKLPTSGVFSAILNLPVQFFQSLLDNLSTSTCKNIEFPLPFVEQNVSIPCVRTLLEQLNALQFYETIGILVGGIAIFNYLMYMGKQFTKMELLQHTNAEFGGL